MDPSITLELESSFRCVSSFVRAFEVVLVNGSEPPIHRNVSLVVLHGSWDDTICFAWHEDERARPVIVVASDKIPTASEAVRAFHRGESAQP
jgi:hypothetical protein